MKIQAHLEGQSTHGWANVCINAGGRQHQERSGSPEGKSSWHLWWWKESEQRPARGRQCCQSGAQQNGLCWGVFSKVKDISQSLGWDGKGDDMWHCGGLDERFSFKLPKENADCGDILHNGVTNPDDNLYSLKKKQRKLNLFFSETTVSSDNIHGCILQLCVFPGYRYCSTVWTCFYKPQAHTFVPNGVLPWGK